MDQVWPWITTLPSSPSGDSPLSLTLGADADKSIVLRAEPSVGPDADDEALLTFSVSLMGFSTPSKTLWSSSPFPLSSSLIHYHFLIQLVQEIISLSPTRSILPYNEVSRPGLDVGPIADAIDTARDSAPALFTLVLICRLFWLCAVEAPADAGFLFFRSVGQAVLGRALDCRPAMRGLLVAVGPDWEERFMRSVGYVIAKWCILRDLQEGPTAGGCPAVFCPCYATSAHGLWVLKGYAPVSGMPRVNGSPTVGSGPFDVKDSVLRYALAHQQLEAVVQLEYNVTMRDPRYIGISVRVDNIRLHVVRLGFAKNKEDGQQQRADDNGMQGERHFPSRVRIWVGPELGSAYATGLSLCRSTGNPERELEAAQTVKEDFGTSKFPTVKARTRSSVRTKGKNWRWEQEAEGNAGVFEGVLCEGETGAEVMAAGGGGGGMRRRYAGVGRAFSKGGGLVVAGDEMGEEGVSWRVGREMEGRNMRWRIGGRVWVSYYPNEVKSGYFETRCVEWRDEVDLPLVAFN